MRRPPLSLNQTISNAIGGAVVKVKETTKAAGERIMDGMEGLGEKLKDGMEGIGNKMEGIGEKIKDTADNIRGKVKDGADNLMKIGRKQSLGDGMDSTTSNKKSMDIGSKEESMDEATSSKKSLGQRSARLRKKNKGSNQDVGQSSMSTGDLHEMVNSDKSDDDIAKISNISAPDLVSYSIPLKSGDDAAIERTFSITSSPKPSTNIEKAPASPTKNGSKPIINNRQSVGLNSIVEERNSLMIPGSPRRMQSFDQSNPNRASSPVRFTRFSQVGSSRTPSISSPTDGRRLNSQQSRRFSESSGMNRENMVLSKPMYPPSYALKRGGTPGTGGILVPKLRRNGKYHYVPRWATREQFQEILISRSMVLDHSPFELFREVRAFPFLTHFSCT
jgi:hypothetical protein